jgi:hypothetical protein
MTYKLSEQACGALLMTLQKCLAEETDIVELLKEWDIEVKDNQIYVQNPPTFEVTKPSFEVPE